jgi:hypothetical protein
MKYRIYQISQNPTNQHAIKCLEMDRCPPFDGSGIEDDVLNNLEFEIKKNPPISSDFYFLHGGALIFNEKVYDSELFTSFEFAGQIFPLNVVNTSDKIYCTNITNCVNILDINNSVFGAEYEDGEKEILKHIFKPNRISTIESLFKLPQDGSRFIYCLSPGDQHDFYKDYKKEKLSGLSFKEIAIFDYKSKGGDWVLEYSK